MSLINQMLKDLEGRAVKPIASETALTGLQAVGNKKKTQRPYLILLGLLSCLFIWTWNLTQLYRSHHSWPVQKSQPNLAARSAQPNIPSVAPAPKPPVEAKAAEAAPLSGALTGISMQAHGKMTCLRFLLDREVFYRVTSDPLEHSVTLTLNNTRLLVNLPPLDFMNSALRDLKINSQRPQEVDIILMLKPEAKLSNLELNKESKYPELQADFLMENQLLLPETPLKVTSQPTVEPVTEPAAGQLKKVAAQLSVDEEYQSALNLAEAGEPDQALQRLKTLVYRNPSYSEARESLIGLLIQQGQPDQAHEFLSAGLHLQPYYPAFLEFKARFLVDDGRVAEALALLKKAPPALATHPEYYAFLAALYQRQGELDAAESLYQQLTALRPEKGAWWLGLGITEEGLGKNAQAMEAYNRADRSPDLDPELRGYVGTRLRG